MVLIYISNLYILLIHLNHSTSPRSEEHKEEIEVDFMPHCTMQIELEQITYHC
jgi:hypothetical protein